MSEVKVNKISPRSGTDVQLGDSGDRILVPCGASIINNGTAVNFGATGSASWVTTVKTSTFTAVAGEGYFIDTTGGEVTVNLPAGTAGAVVAVKDYAGTFDTNKLTLVQNGSDKIGGSALNATLSTEGIAVTLVFIDSTQGWLVTDDGLQSNADTNPYIEATGGTITTSGNDKIHTFTGPGTFTVNVLAQSAANNEISYVVLAGGAGGGSAAVGGGGGAGGFREDKSPITPYTASPLDGAGPITVTATSFPITVGGGGAKGPANGSNPSGVDGTSGSVSTFSTITSAGGGGGSSRPSTAGTAGASGGGGQGDGSAAPGGAGNTPPTSPAQGTAGGAARTVPGCRGGGGGGGATVAGGDGQPPYYGGDGGAGATTSISGSPLAYGGGGGGGGGTSAEASGGDPGSSIGGRGGGNPSSPQGKNGGDATASRGSGGGGGGTCGGSGAGGNGSGGTVIIRYKYQ